MFFESPEPVRVDHNGVHTYTTTQIDLYGLPYMWGVYDYCIIEGEPTHTTDWKFEQSRRGALRPIHRYSRVKRFESTLFQLIGERGDIELGLVNDIKSMGYNKDPKHIWESLREILKQSGLRHYYNRIPTIIQMLGLPYRIKVLDPREIVRDFMGIDVLFNRMYPTEGKKRKKYFPSLRFVCLKMLERHDAKFQFTIPLIRTPRKLKPLEEVWRRMLSSLPK